MPVISILRKKRGVGKISKEILISFLVIGLFFFSPLVVGERSKELVDDNIELKSGSYESYKLELEENGKLNLTVRTLEGSMGRLEIDIYLLEPSEFEKFKEGEEFENITGEESSKELRTKRDLDRGVYYLVIRNNEFLFSGEVEVRAIAIYLEDEKKGDSEDFLEDNNFSDRGKRYLGNFCFITLIGLISLFLLVLIGGIKR